MPTPPLGQPMPTTRPAPQPTPAPPAPYPPRAYTVLFWFLVIGQILASFTALVAVATLLATARPVMQWQVQIPPPPPGPIAISPEDLACTTDADCAPVTTTCGGCDCGSAVNRTNLPKYEELRRALCERQRGPECVLECLPPTPRCYAGRCFLSTEQTSYPLPVVDTTGWQTYRNEELRISFQVPPEFTVSEIQDEYKSKPDVIVSKGKLEKQKNYVYDKAFIDIGGAMEGEDIVDIKRLWSDVQTYSIAIDGDNFEAVEGLDTAGNQHLYIDLTGHSIRISAVETKVGSTIITAKQILSTFKFIQ